MKRLFLSFLIMLTITVCGTNIFAQGTGSDGSVTVTGTTYTDDTRSHLTANASSGQANVVVNSSTGFSNGQLVLVIQMDGTGAGRYEERTISSISSGTITLTGNLVNAYSSGGSNKAQLIKINQYTSVTINSGGTLTCHAWDGNTGGVIYFKASGTVTNNGTITANEKGFIAGTGGTGGYGGSGGNGGAGGTSGHPAGYNGGVSSVGGLGGTLGNDGGDGAATGYAGSDGSAGGVGTGPGAGSGSASVNSSNAANWNLGSGTDLLMGSSGEGGTGGRAGDGGGGGGGGGYGNGSGQWGQNGTAGSNGSVGGNGGNGGGIIVIIANTLTGNGAIEAKGQDGQNGNTGANGGNGGNGGNKGAGGTAGGGGGGRGGMSGCGSGAGNAGAGGVLWITATTNTYSGTQSASGGASGTQGTVGAGGNGGTGGTGSTGSNGQNGPTGVTNTGCATFTSYAGATGTTVSCNTVATITATPSSTLCSGQSVTLSAGAGTSYAWSTGGTTSSITVSPTTTTTYSATITTSGCVAVGTKTIMIPIDLGRGDICQNNVTPVGKEIWFKFIADSQRVRIVATTSSVVLDSMNLYGGTCGALSLIFGQVLGITNDTLVIDEPTLTIGNTYFIKINVHSQSNINICISNLTANFKLRGQFSACGLGYKQVSVPMNTRTTSVTPQGAGSSQPTNFTFSGVPACFTLVEAYLYFTMVGAAPMPLTIPYTFSEASLGNNSVTASRIGVNTSNNATGWQNVYNNLDATASYLTSVTSLVSSLTNLNTTFSMSGISVNPSASPNRDLAGATLLLIYEDLSTCATARPSTLVLWDGLSTNNAPSIQDIWGQGWSNPYTSNVNNRGFFILSDAQCGSNSTPSYPTCTPIQYKMNSNTWIGTLTPITGPVMYTFQDDPLTAPLYSNTTIPFQFVSISTDVYDVSVLGIYTQDGTQTCTHGTALSLNAAATPTAVCQGACSTLSASASAGSGSYSYTWSGPSGIICTNCNNISVCPTVTTTYSVTVTDACGCTAAAQATVTVNPTPSITSITGTSIVCLGSCLTLNGSASGGTGTLTYAWTPTTGLSNPSITNPQACPTAFTSYTFTATDANGCSGSASVAVFVNPTPTVSIGSLGSLCLSGSVTLTASGGGTYSWAPGGQTTASIVVTAGNATMYTVTVTDANGCTDTEATWVTNECPDFLYEDCRLFLDATVFNSNPTITNFGVTIIELNSASPPCSGSVSSTGNDITTNMLTYTTPPSPTSVFSYINLPPGHTALDLFSHYGYNATLESWLGALTVGKDYEITFQASYNGGISYSAFAADCIVPVITTCTTTVVSKTAEQNASESEKVLMDFDFFPNPASSSITLTYSVEPEQTGYFELYDILGNICITNTLNANKKAVEINISELSGGVYYGVVKIDQNIRGTKKLIIAK